jgi:predicted DNA-binding antitoxin AbrB/MazE fold protein
MLNTVEAVVHDGKIKLIEPVALNEGDLVLVTLLGQQEAVFWRNASESSLEKIWVNDEDDVYASLLKE